MTLPEFEELALTVLGLASASEDRLDLSEGARVTLMVALVTEYAVRMPSEVAAYREAVAQQQGITDAVKLAASMGKLQTFVADREPS